MKNREIKFRAWHTPTKRFMDSYFHIDNIGRLLIDNGNMWKYIAEVDYILMQSTGLKDENGIEIYEGDIIKTDGGNFEVNFTLSAVTPCFVLGDSPFIKYINDLEVIGNIYENPELLNK